MERKSTIIIALAIIVSFTFLSASIIYTSTNHSYKSTKKNQNVNHTEYRYEMITHESNLIIFDQETGQYWFKFIDQNSAPTEWTKEAPNLN